MATMRAGGDPEQYMDPPTMSVGGNDSSGESGSFLAGILDALGIHRQVAKGPKDSKGDGKKNSGGQKQEQLVGLAQDGPIPVSLPVLDMMSQSMAPPLTQQPTTPFGQRWMDSVAPILTFDPGASTAKRM